MYTPSLPAFFFRKIARVRRNAFPFVYPSFSRIDGSTGDIVDAEGFWLLGGNYGYGEKVRDRTPRYWRIGSREVHV